MALGELDWTRRSGPMVTLTLGMNMISFYLYVTINGSPGRQYASGLEFLDELSWNTLNTELRQLASSEGNKESLNTRVSHARGSDPWLSKHTIAEYTVLH